jgi:hypothetical protein
MSSKIEEALNTILEHMGLTGEEGPDLEMVSAGIKSREGGNNPCGHEGQAHCPMRCKQDAIGPGSVYHCHVNNCGGNARCNAVVDVNC